MNRGATNQNHKSDPTRERILNEAEALFAQKGYHAVSVREVTTAAECNLAAINYHFGHKKNLYLEVFRSRWLPRSRRVRASFREALAAHDTVSPKEMVQALAEAFLRGPLSDEERQRHHQLMVRELGQPSEAFEMVAEQAMRPFFQDLAETLRPFMPKGLEEERLLLNVLSTFAVVLYFNFARVAVTRVTGRPYDDAFKALLVETIVGFCTKGLEGREKEEGL
jgi:AcrR family transcriptional regulator